MSRPLLLTYRTLGLGDLLTAVPALRALRRGFPDHHHVLAAPGWLAPLVSMLEAVDEHLELPELGELPAGIGPVDVAVDLHGRGPQSHRRLTALSPRRLIGFAHPEVPRSAGAPDWRDDEHEVERWCRLLDAEGLPADPRDLHLEPPAGPVPEGARGAVVVHPGAKSAARRWPVARFATVARALTDHGRRVVVTGSPDEQGLAEDLASAAGLPDGAVLAGRTDLGALTRVVAAAALVVAGDTGVAHLATATRTPSVVVFGPTPPRAWGPPAHLRRRHRVLWAGDTGDPLADEVHPGLLAITPDDVLSGIDALEDDPHVTPAA